MAVNELKFHVNCIQFRKEGLVKNETITNVESKNLLIFESGLQYAREYWLQDLKNLGYKLFLAQPWPLTWESPYISEYHKVLLNPWTIDEKERLIKFLIENKIHGIICLNEGTVPFASEIIEALNLPRFTSFNIKHLRNKYQMRSTLLNSEILQPEFILINESSESNLEKIKFPSIVKPVEMMSSLGVKLVNTNGELINAISDAQKVDFHLENLRMHYGFDKGVLIESYLEGQEFSIESFFQNGILIDYFLTKKFKCPEPFFDEIGHLANPILEKSQHDAIHEFIIKLHHNLKILNAITHTEVKILGNKIGLIEIGCRPGGDLIPKIHQYSSGVSFPSVLANICLGKKVDCNWLPLDQRKQVAVFFPHDTVYKKTSKYEIEKVLIESQIFEYIFEETEESINEGLATVRKGQIVFSNRVSTEAVMNQLVDFSGGIR